MIVGCVVDRVSRHAGGLFQSVRRLAQSLATANDPVLAFGIEDEDSAVDMAEWQPVPVEAFPSKGARVWGYSSRLVSGNTHRLHRIDGIGERAGRTSFILTECSRNGR